MQTPVKTIAPVRIVIAIRLMILFAIHTLKDVGIWLTDFGSCMLWQPLVTKTNNHTRQ